MNKKIVSIALLLLLAFSASAFAQINTPPKALITGVKAWVDNHDTIDLICADWDTSPIFTPDYRCTTTKWYYFLADDSDCSASKSDYVNSVEEYFRGLGGWPVREQSKGEIYLSCPEEWVDYVCLWVEDGMGASAIFKSAEILVDCTIGSVAISEPTASSQVTKNSTDDTLEVKFIVNEPDVVSYTITISSPTYGTIYSNTVPISASGEYTDSGSSWAGATDGAYDITIMITDKGGLTASDTESGALIIETPEAPECLSTANIYLIGTSTGKADALNLNDICTDPEGDSIAYSIVNPADCLGSSQNLVESVSVNAATGIVSVGAVPAGRNETITDFSDTCEVQYKATDAGGLGTLSTFGITVFQTGEIEIKIRYPSKANGGTDLDLDEIGVLKPVGIEPGDEVCFDIVIENNISPFVTGKPLDLAFVLDASGSMDTEIASVKNTIQSIADYVTTMCLAGDVPTADCFRMGVVVMEGKKTTGAFAPGEWQKMLTSDIVSIKSFVSLVVASCSMEPWADYVINLIWKGASNVKRTGSALPVNILNMDWRPGATKLIIVITDASNNGQSVEVYNSNQIAAYAVPANIIVSGLGMASGCDPSGCPLACNPASCPVGAVVSGEMWNVAQAIPGGNVFVYAKDEADITAKILELVKISITNDDVKMEMTEGTGDWIKWPAGFPLSNPDFDGIINVERGKTAEIQNVCITANGEDLFKFKASNPETDKDLDEFEIEIEFGAVEPTIAVIAPPPGTIYEGMAVEFDGTDSTSGSSDPINSWDWTIGTDSLSGDIVPYAFPDNGVYPVTLKVTTINNVTDTRSINVTVENLPPSGGIESDYDAAVIGSPIKFTAAFDDVPADLPLSSITWDFDDGSPPATGEIVSHDWDNQGFYTVTANACDKDGGCTSASKTIRIGSIGDVISVKSIVLKNDGEETTVFGSDDLIEIDLAVGNHYIDPVWGRVPIEASWEINVLDAVTREVLYTISSTENITIGVVGLETVILWIDLSDPAYSIPAGNYAIEASVRVEEAGVTETYTANNSGTKAISIGLPQRPMPVPELPLFIVPLVLLSVLFLMRKSRH